jgi:hypothetical protein
MRPALEQELTAAAESLGLPVLDTSSREAIRAGLFAQVDWAAVPGVGSREEYQQIEGLLPGGNRNPDANAIDHRGWVSTFGSPPGETGDRSYEAVRLAQVLGRVRMLAGAGPEDFLLVRYQSFSEGVLGMLVRAQRGRDGLPVGNLAGITGLGMGDGTLVEPRPHFLRELVRLGIAFEEGDEYIAPSLLKVTATGDFPSQLQARVIGVRWLGQALPVWLGVLAGLCRDRVVRITAIGPDWAEVILPNLRGKEVWFDGLALGIRYAQDSEAAELRVFTLVGREGEARARFAKRLQDEVVSRVPVGTTVTQLVEDAQEAGLAEQTANVESAAVSSVTSTTSAGPLRVYISAAGVDGGPRLTRFTELLGAAIESTLHRPVRLNGFIPSEMALGSEIESAATRDLFAAELFIAILTDDYLDSGWCGREFAAFVQARPGGAELEGRVWLVPWKGRLLAPAPEALRNLQVVDPPGGDLVLEALVEADPGRVRRFLEDLARRHAIPLQREFPPSAPVPGELREFESAFGQEELSSSTTGTSADLEWAVPMLEALAMAFHLGRVDGAAISERHSWYGLSESEKGDFSHVWMMCEYLFGEPLSGFLSGGGGPFQPNPEWTAVLDGLSREKGDQAWYRLQDALRSAAAFGDESDRQALARILGASLDQTTELQETDRRVEALRRVLQSGEAQGILQHYSAEFFHWQRTWPSSASGLRDFPSYVTWVTERWLSYVERLIQRGADRLVEIQAPAEAAERFFRRLPRLRPARVEQLGSGRLRFSLTLPAYLRAGQEVFRMVDEFVRLAAIRPPRQEGPPASGSISSQA